MLTRIPWAFLLVSVVVVLSGAFAASPIVDAVTRGPVTGASLSRPPGYVVIAPLSDVLDMLSLLSARQHAALLAGLALVFIAWRVLRARHGAAPRAHVVAAAWFVAGIVGTYVAVAVLPRPMAALDTDDVNVLRVDFHSHTSASHDGRPGWNAEKNRAWHAAGGYDAAYVTDHGSVAGAERGLAFNASRAADGVLLLQGIEVTWTGEHVAILGAERAYKGLLTTNHRDVDTAALHLGSLIPGREPVVIWNHPRRLGRLPAATGPGTSGTRGIEVSNGAPDSMDEVRRTRASIVAFAQQHGLALTTGSDNHGWGRTAPNWTLMLIAGWRGMSADELGSRIEGTIRRGGIAATQVVERRTAEGTSAFGLAVTAVTAPARMLTTISAEERVSWLLWTWALYAAWRLRRRRALS